MGPGLGYRAASPQVLSQLFTMSGQSPGSKEGRVFKTRLAFAVLGLALLAVALPAPQAGAAESPGARTLAVALDALSAMRGRKWTSARRLIAKLDDPVAAKVLTWHLLTRARTGATFEDFAQFAEANPDWPRQRRLAEQVEFAIDKRTSDARIVAWFEDHPPVSFVGLTRRIDALQRQGQALGAAVVARRAWIEETFRAKRAKRFFRKYRSMLRLEDHAARLEALLWKGHVNTARRLLKSVEFDAATRRTAEARLLLRSRATRGKKGRRRVERALARVPEARRGLPGLIYDRVRWTRRNKMGPESRELLRNAPSPAGHDRKWWRERNIHIRERLKERDPSEAYDLARGHGHADGLPMIEAEWIAGWIALRQLDWPQAAFKHFTKVYMGTTSPISRARGAYWLGRAAEAQDRDEWANKWYSEAARYPTTFYGQFASASLGHDSIDLPPDPSPSPAERRAFDDMELVQAVHFLQRLGRQNLIGPFLARLRTHGESRLQLALVAELATEIGDAPATLRTGKRAARAGHVLTSATYPMMQLAPQAKIELPLLLALIRQESEFEPDVVSPAGARGLMQLMPYTARRVAKTLRLRYDRRRLTSDLDYNVRLGTTYLAGLIDQYNGSYVLSLAAYNAGPQNVRNWVRRFGDPGQGTVDIVDWIESIPFGETRNYVQRILESLQAYRALFGETRLAAAASDELWRSPAQIAATKQKAHCIAQVYSAPLPGPC